MTLHPTDCRLRSFAKLGLTSADQTFLRNIEPFPCDLLQPLTFLKYRCFCFCFRVSNKHFMKHPFLWFLICFLFLSESALACKVAFPNEQRCESQVKVPVSGARLSSLKKALEKFYNQREKFILEREKSMTSAQMQKVNRSSCFNLRHAEMYINFLLQVSEKSSRLCKDHVKMLLSSIEQMTDFKNEENQFIKDHKHKTILIDQSMEVTSLAEAIKLEMESL